MSCLTHKSGSYDAWSCVVCLRAKLADKDEQIEDLKRRLAEAEKDREKIRRLLMQCPTEYDKAEKRAEAAEKALAESQARDREMRAVVELVANQHRGHINRWMSIKGRSRTQFSCELCDKIAALESQNPKEESDG